VTDAVRHLIAETMGIPVLGTHQSVEAFKIDFERGQGSGVHINADL